MAQNHYYTEMCVWYLFTDNFKFSNKKKPQKIKNTRMLHVYVYAYMYMCTIYVHVPYMYMCTIYAYVPYMYIHTVMYAHVHDYMYMCIHMTAYNV